jgi:hypothetical protein
MRRKIVTICEICGGAEPSGAADFVVFHCLMFCSPDCLDDYRAADAERRTKTEAALAQSNGARSRAA